MPILLIEFSWRVESSDDAEDGGVVRDIMAEVLDMIARGPRVAGSAAAAGGGLVARRSGRGDRISESLTASMRRAMGPHCTRVLRSLK